MDSHHTHQDSHTRDLAHLVIHTEAGAKTWTEQLRALVQAGFRPSAMHRHGVDSGKFHVEVLNRQGQRVAVIDEARTHIDLPLPAGTYHVKVHIGVLHRNFTLALEKGASFDLQIGHQTAWNKRI